MKILKRLVWMMLGYFFAVFTATLVTVTLIVAISVLPDQARFGSFYKVTADIFGLLYVGVIITSSYALPGWLISVAIAAWRAEQRKSYFIIAGALTALLAHLLLSGLAGGLTFGITGEFGGIFVWSVIGGLCGGWAYWRVAEVRFGKWIVSK